MVAFARVAAEMARLTWMRGLEDALEAAGLGPVAGVDEVGRGCLAGPVTVAAYVPRPGALVPGVDDSKKLSPEVRAALGPRLRDASLACAVVSVQAAEIDRCNILEATRQAMISALADVAAQLSRRFSITLGTVLTDAMPMPPALLHADRCVSTVKADSLAYSVACASILAKVDRDGLMTELDRLHPHFGFADHKGYGSEGHLAALRRFGPCREHRLSFSSVLPRRRAA